MLQIFLSVILVFALSGCATMGKGKNIKQLEVQVSDLEYKLQEKDDQIRKLETQLGQIRKDADKISAKKADLSKVAKKDIQQALTNAGFYNGPVDGKFGQQTATAILEFQKANGLKQDGKVGQQTWTKLSEYLK